MKDMNMKQKWILTSILAWAMVLCMTSVALADEDDPPGRVARLSYRDGAVSFEPAGTEEWLDADPNRPITRGDRLWTDQESRAELQIGSASIRCADQTGLSFLDLTDEVVQIQLAEGAMSIQLRDLDEGEIFEIDTPNLAFTLQRPGDYRIEVSPEGGTVVSVRRGLGEVTGGSRVYSVRSNQRASFLGTEELDAYIDQVGEYDEFDQWCHNREARQRNAISTRYVSRGVIGYEDLDEYGEWQTVPQYGAVWFPRHVAVGWAPYRYGHWTWIAPWGWTWIDDAPWGFAPFHYGRWAYVGDTWGWCPGPRVSAGLVVRPVYAPALVAWVGSPSLSVGISLGGGSIGVGWFPLAPREVYVPPYRVSRTYVTNINVTNTVVNNVNAINVYENPRTPTVRYVNRTALTAVPRTAFVSAEPVARNVVRVNPAQATRVQVTANIGVVPQEQSVAPMTRRARVRPPVELRERPVVVKTAPPPAPVPFARQRDAIEANGGRPLGRQEAERLEPQRRQPAPVKVEKPAVAAPVPVESVAKPESEAPKQPERRGGPRGRPFDRPPGRGAAPEPEARPGGAREPSQPESGGPPPAEAPKNPKAPQANPPQPPERPEQPPDVNAPPERSTQEKSPREQRMDQVHQQEQQRLLLQQEQERRQLEQRHQEQEHQGRPPEDRNQQLEHQRLEQQQVQQRLELRKRQQQERERLQQEEGKQPKKGRGRNKKEPPPKT